MNWPKFDSDHVMVSASQMLIFEKEIIQSGMPVEALMEKVGGQMSLWLLNQKDLLRSGVLFLIGPGHNGGDGLVVARELHLAGIKVKIWCPFLIQKKLTSKHLSNVRWIGLEEIDFEPDPSEEILWVEALFGLGQQRSLPKSIAKLLERRQKLVPGRLISLDVPAGICSDTGKKIEGIAAFASHTLTVGLLKKGLLQDNSLGNVGKIIRLDIGLKISQINSLPFSQPLCISSSDLIDAPFPIPDPALSKYDRGNLLIIAGSETYPGAASLAIKGAISSGVGVVKALIPNRLAKTLWQTDPEVIIAGIIDYPLTDISQLKGFFEKFDFKSIDSLLIGPGLGRSIGQWEEIEKYLEAFEGLLILDADGINLLSFSSEGWEWFKKRKGPTWITPHIREFQRLFPNLIDLEPLDAVSEASRKSGISILLKGAHSIVVDKSGHTHQLVETIPYVARAGLGDVLAGYAAGLGAIGFSIGNPLNFELLTLAALIHSEASRICKKGTSASLISQEIACLTRNLQIDAL